MQTHTWDGLLAPLRALVAAENPHGASVVVYRRTGTGLEFLILHRAHGGPDYEGDWAWCPPSGARLPGESIKSCARRELEEETGLRLAPIPTAFGTPEWEVFLAQAPAGVEVVLSAEHDRFEWVGSAEARSRCLPAVVGWGLARVAALLQGRTAA